MANSVTGVTTAIVVVVTTHTQAILRPNSSASSITMKCAAVCVGWSASSASRGKPSVCGSKKSGATPRPKRYRLSRRRMTQRPLNWNSTNSGHLSSRSVASAGFGSPCIVAYAVGDRSEATCRKLWERIPAAYRPAHCYPDFWEAYRSNVIPDEQHTACGKDSGLAAHVERWNNTLRQRLTRFVRKT